MRHDEQGERGAATVVVVGVMVALVALLMGVLALGRAGVIAERTHTAADMLALESASLGRCSPGEEAMRRYKVIVSSCTVRGNSATVKVTSKEKIFGRDYSARAVAGPAEGSDAP